MLMNKEFLKEKARNRAYKLNGLLSKYGYEYYVLDNPSVDDDVYDSLKNELREIELQFPDLILPNSPSQRVGGDPLKYFNSGEHIKPMLSIEDIFNEGDVYNWEKFLQRQTGLNNFSYFCETKTDGLAIALRYKKGVLDKTITRGNGKKGEIITANAKTVRSIPLQIFSSDNFLKNTSMDFEVRGEIYISKDNFEKFNNRRDIEGDTQYANPRNLAAGSIRNLDPKVTQERPLSFRAYDIIIEDNSLTTHHQKHLILKSLGFPVDLKAVECKNIEEVINYWKKIESSRDSNKVPIDGVVVRVNSLQVFNSLGVSGRSPRGIRALKFKPMSVTTKLNDIIIQIGRTGVATPVAVLEPVRLAGVLVSRATLHNKEEIERLDARIGDTVVVIRAGDVIPAINKVIKDIRTGNEKKFIMPKNCSVCGNFLVQKEGQVAFRCINKKCFSKKKQAFSYFVSRNNFDIEGLGPRVLEKLIDKSLLGDVADIFLLTKDDILQIDNQADKSADNIIESINKSKTIQLDKLLTALNIQYLGAETAFDLSKKFGTINAIKNAKKEDIASIRGVGDVVATSVSKWFDNKDNLALIDKLLNAGVVIENEAQNIKSELEGKSFVFTGVLKNMHRTEAQNEIRNRGGEVSTSVSSKTSFVVLGENPGTKKDQAEELNIPILTENEFIKILQK